ncbi:MAG: hypothetical protein HFI23_07280 [Lachnospiraceae bacterium]|nr:hypothetical protein [Lachnospiraceae bacterium]
MLVVFCLGILMVSVCLAVGFALGLKYSNQEVVKMHTLSLKHRGLFEIAVKWIKEPQKIENYLIQKEFKKVSIYGMSYLGDCLTNTLRKDGIEVVCGIDRNADKLYNPYIPIYNLEDELPQADVIIVTTLMYYEQIKSELEMKMNREINIISLEEILYG